MNNPQNIAEYFRLQLKQKMWRGMRTHAAQGYNLGKVLDGYLPDKVPHPAPSKAAQGRTKTLLVGCRAFSGHLYLRYFMP